MERKNFKSLIKSGGRLKLFVFLFRDEDGKVIFDTSNSVEHVASVCTLLFLVLLTFVHVFL